MSAAASSLAASITTLYRRALSLGAVNAISYAVQFLLPVVVARFLLQRLPRWQGKVAD